MQLDQMPEPTWEADELAKYAVRQLKEEMNLGRRTLPVMFRAGFALTLLKEQKKGKRLWVKYQKENGFARTTVNHAERIYKHLKDKDPESWAEWTITQAKVESGIIRKPTKKTSQRSRYVLPKPNTKNALDVMDLALDVLTQALNAAEKGADKYDVDAQARFAKLAESLLQLGRDAKKAAPRKLQAVGH